MNASPQQVPLVLPDLGLGDEPITTTLWLVARGGRVSRGDRILEVLSGCATVDLPAPADGVLVEKLVGEDERVRVGQVLGLVEVRGP
jgi:pyruvate/2-oxoglutarate dehydrogenase complex dihydrolipoamide acyltransferase (E2) component